MSYCRWSGDNWTCDLYCYADASGGYTTHVAGRRLVEAAPRADFPRGDTTDADWEAFAVAHEAQMEWLNTAERKDIGGPYDGESFNDPDLASFLARVTMLRDAGYNVPEYVFDAINDEMAEEAR